MRKPIGVIGICLVILVCAGAGGALGAAESLHFLAIGDTGTGSGSQEQVAEAMAKYADKQQGSNAIEFVLMLGDNFYNDGVRSVKDPQWQEKFEKIYDPRRLAVPFYVVLGNHDWRGDLPDVQIDYARLNPNSRWKMDGHFYKRQFPAKQADTNATPLADFFFIDSEVCHGKSSHAPAYPDKKLPEKQMVWLEEQLKDSKARWKFVIAHHPIYSNGTHGHDGQTLDLRKRLGPLLNKYSVDAYIAGHDHDLQRIEVPDQPTLFLVSGAGSKLRSKAFNDWKPFHASKLGFAAIQLSEKEMFGEFLDVDGNRLDSWTRKPLSLTQKN